MGETELKIPELWKYFFKWKAIDSCKYFYIDEFETASYGLQFFYLKEQLPQMLKYMLAWKLGRFLKSILRVTVTRRQKMNLPFVFFTKLKNV